MALAKKKSLSATASSAVTTAHRSAPNTAGVELVNGSARHPAAAVSNRPSAFSSPLAALRSTLRRTIERPPTAAPEPSSERLNGMPSLGFRTGFARNLILARNAAGFTQDALAEASGISRATIAQIETGDNDSRLSTVGEIASALSVSPLLLFLRQNDITALIRHLPKGTVERVLGHLSAEQIGEMHALLDSGLQRNVLRAAQAGVAAVAESGLTSPGAKVGAAIGSALQPGIGTAVGAIFGDALTDRPRHPTLSLEGGEGI